MATNFAKLTVLDLRQELRRRGLTQTGKKADLVERLVAFETSAPTQTLDRSSDSPSAHSEPKSNPNDNSALEKQLSEDLPIAQSPGVPEPPRAPVPDLGAQSDSAQASEEMSIDDDLKVELAPPAEEQPSTAMGPIQNTKSRKRRSRSPPPDDELSRKRARAEDEVRTEANENVPGEDVSYAIIQPAVPKSILDANSRTPPRPETDHPTQDDITARFEEHGAQHLQSAENMEEHEDEVEDDRNVAPAEHRATPALYIKNFMRPLRDTILRNYLAEIATPRGSPADHAVIEDFHLDQIRTHAFVRFRTMAAASRARIALHGRIWPNERERKPLWVDFIPAEAVAEWADREKSEGGRGTRWEVRYETDNIGETTARLMIADTDTARAPPPPPPPGPQPTSFAAGSSRPHEGIESAPLGPRGRGSNTYRQQPFSSFSEGFKETRAYPSLSYRPVSAELAERRLQDMRKYYTQDRNRNLGRPDEINRYTFEQGDMFVDRGKENFIGIRPPHRERERQRALASGDYRGPRGLRGSSPSYPSRGERYFGGNRNSRYSGGRRNDRHAVSGRDYRYSDRYDDRRDRNDGRYSGRYDDRRDRRDDRYSDRYDDRQGRKDDHYSSGGRDRHEDDRYGRNAPRSRLDGAPLPTYDGSKFGGHSGRRDDYRGGRR